MRFIDGRETTVPGSTSILADTINKQHQWLNFESEFQSYFLKNKFIHFQCVESEWDNIGHIMKYDLEWMQFLFQSNIELTSKML